MIQKVDGGVQKTIIDRAPLRPANFLRNFYSARKHFYGFFYMGFLCAGSFHRREETKKTTRKNQEGNQLSCESKLWLETWARTGDQQKKPSQAYRSINYTSCLRPCRLSYFFTTGFWFLYSFLDMDLAQP